MISAPLDEQAEHPTVPAFVAADEIRTRFSSAMSALYRQEVPQYGLLLDLVAEVNATALRHDPALLAMPGEAARLDVERHGAIRVGTAQELCTLRRIFAVMGMFPVGYYDLSVAGIPVHSTAFRPVAGAALAANPFRVFTSLLRTELITDGPLREQAAGILARRNIFTPRALALTARHEANGGLSSAEADEFVQEVLHTFRWHSASTVPHSTYLRMRDAHRLVADVVCFPGPHINHLTPRTLDIDAAQAAMPRRGIAAKEVIEGPPRRKVPLLLRQTSFKALEEPVRFAEDAEAGAPEAAQGGAVHGAHTARFGEIEQRGIALTPQGRALYDSLLQRAQEQGEGGRGRAGGSPADYPARLAQAFEAFPDDLDSLRREGLGFFRYTLQGQPAASHPGATSLAGQGMEALVAQGIVQATPITYEDFLPVSAAGIFQSNLGEGGPKASAVGGAQAAFEQALGAPVADEMALYAAEQAASVAQVRRQLGQPA